MSKVDKIDIDPEKFEKLHDEMEAEWDKLQQHPMVKFLMENMGAAIVEEDEL